LIKLGISNDDRSCRPDPEETDNSKGDEKIESYLLNKVDWEIFWPRGARPHGERSGVAKKTRTGKASRGSRETATVTVKHVGARTHSENLPPDHGGKGFSED